MTTTLTRSDARPAPDTSAQATGGWRVATRLARREVRRRWGRTVLVMFLVAVPVFGMTVITTLVRTAHDAPARQFAEQFGSANLVSTVNGSAPAPPGGWPAGTEIARGREVSDIGLVATNGVARLANVTDFDLNNPVMKGAVLLRAGRFPARPGEALVSPKIAKAFGVKIGDTLRLAEPAWTERIVGIGVPATNWTDGLLAVRGNELDANQFQSSFDQLQQLTLVRLPGHPSAHELQSYDTNYFSAFSPLNNNTTKAVNWTLVAGMIALAIAGVVISGAFAVGARRQLVTLGQLSANGAGESLLKRMLSLQGAWCGVLGTGFGMAAGITTLTVMHAHFDEWIHRDIGAYVWSPRDLIAIAIVGVLAATLAAYFPARSAARVPVLSALNGRRPLGALPRSIVPIGLALFGMGVMVLALVAAASRNGGGNSLAAAAVFGGLLVLSGACCVSPVVVASLAHVGRSVRGSGRVALRSIVRSRARSAAVVMALAAINGGAIAVGTAFASRTVQTGVGDPSSTMPDNTLVLVRHTTPFNGATPALLPLDPSAERTIKTILPKATWNERRAVAGTVNTPVVASNGGPQLGAKGARPGIKRILLGPGPGGIVVADPAVLSLVGLSSSDLATLQRTGVMVFPQSDLDNSSPVTVTIGEGAAAQTIPASRPAHRVKATAGIQALVTAAEAQRLHAQIVDAGAIVTNPTSFNESQRASIDALTPTIMFGANSGDPNNPPSEITDLIWSGPRSRGISADTVRQIILAIVVLVALIILAMSLALSSAETRDERDVLVSLGAKPRTMRGVAAWKAATLSFTGAALAIPTGFIPVAVVYYAAVRTHETAHLAFPWSTAFALLIVAPLIGALVAGIGSAIAQRVRPTHMSTFATD
jgi:putative ABC transport system permease protein